VFKNGFDLFAYPYAQAPLMLAAERAILEPARLRPSTRGVYEPPPMENCMPRQLVAPEELDLDSPGRRDYWVGPRMITIDEPGWPVRAALDGVVVGSTFAARVQQGQHILCVGNVLRGRG